MQFLPPIVFRNPTIRVSMLAIFFYGFAGAATSPYQSVVGIRELGLSNGTYSAIIFSAAAVNVVVSLMVGNLADRLGDYRSMMMAVILFGVLGYGSVYILPSRLTFVASALVMLPVFNAVTSLLFANVRTATNRMAGQDARAVNSGVRAVISLAWVLVPGVVGAALSRSESMLPAYLIGCLACVVCFLLVALLLPGRSGTDTAMRNHLSHLAAIGEVVSPRTLVRVLAVALVTSTLQINGALLPLITTGAAGGKVSDIGVLVGIVALLEVVFIIVWGRLLRRMHHVTALAAGTALYVVYLALLGLASQPWHLYVLTLVAGSGDAALISIPITYLQDLIVERPGLGSALISVNLFMSGGISAVLFALGTWLSTYSGTALLGAAAGLAGLCLLLVLERPFARAYA